MSDNTALITSPAADLAVFDRLVGSWSLSGGISGATRFEWHEGGFFLVQRSDIHHDGQTIRSVEYIGHDRSFGEAPSADIVSRVYTTTGDTLTYVWEFDGVQLTIWGGEKGSPAYFRGEFDASGTVCKGDWVWPGGGYSSVMTRIAAR
ncbi:hypothetical protein JGU71_23710 [Antrihabitans sp. YC3-6]|uniref:DUF1579 domain-containing protein n=1 Tax=Antrihabitans stalagmiti TaxID=2799499 RepID=A0A934U603_9NOCA|nr:hypothetical protein [Antrihabitans stalagmiti]MBJ8341897.1 hypothetical protein [Antrihabitans stalagmiti]